MLIFSLVLQCLFTPPDGWVEPGDKMPTRRSLGSFVEKRNSGFCPSVNLTSEKVEISIQEYLKAVEATCKSKKQTWRHMGQIASKAGKAELTQIEMSTKFGDLRLFQAILIQDGVAYILTTSALKKEFGKYAGVMEKSIRSLSFKSDED